MRPIGAWFFLWFLLLIQAAGCRSETDTPQTGSESHFLSACSATCDQGFECLCGVCTERCTGDDACALLHERAECVAVADRPEASRCDESAGPAFCDVRCTADADCAGLGVSFTCQAGFCREGAGPVGDRIELAEVCDLYVSIVCHGKIECYGWDYENYEGCLLAQECDGLSDLEAMLAAGSVRYDAEATAVCAARLSADPCAFGLLLGVPPLAGALAMCDSLTGELPVGATCTSDVECSPGLDCDLENTCPGACVVPPADDDLPAGAACVTEICIPAQDHCSQCALGLDCINEICVTTPVLGDPCAELLDCGNPLWCDPTAGRCAPRAALGEACSDFRQIAPNCEDGLWCDDPPAQPEIAGTCRVPALVGEQCRDDSNCVEPLSCAPVAGTTPSDHGVCGDRQPDGSLCDSFDDCVSDLCSVDTCVPQPALGEECISTCAEGFVCDTVCLAKRYAGQGCDAASECQNSRCIDGLCTNRGHFGDACAVADDCLSGYCNGVCADPVGCEG